MKKMIRNNNYAAVKLSGIPYLLPYGQMTAVHARGMQVNETVLFLWDVLETEHSLEELLECCITHYEIPSGNQDEFRKDISALVNQLLSYGAFIKNRSIDFFPGTPPVSVSAVCKNPSETYENTSVSCSIAGLSMRITGPKESIPEEFRAFAKSAADTSVQKICFLTHSGTPVTNGTLIIHTPELVVKEWEDTFVLWFPLAEHMNEMRISKEGTQVSCYIVPPFTRKCREEIFHALRLSFLYFAAKHNMVALHSASILYQGKAWLFSGRSGMGKSTHTCLWKSLYEVSLLNGDLNLISLSEKDIKIHGIPWCGTSAISNTETHPLGGVILLSRSATDFIEELTPDQKALLLSQRFVSPVWTKEQFLTTLDIAGQIAARIPVCKLHCTKEPSAAVCMKEYIDSLSSEIID